jgi:hypothetical protein
MRKLILVFPALLLLLGGACQRPADNVLDTLKPGAQVTLTATDGRTLTGRVTEARGDAVVLQPPTGQPVTVPRADIASVTIPVAAARTAGGPDAAAGSAPGQEPAVTPQPSADRKAGASNAASQAAPRAAELAPPTAKPAPAWREVTVPEGTPLAISLDESLASDRSRVEESVRATLLEDVTVHGVTAIPAGSLVTGSVMQAKRAGKVKGVAELAVRFDAIAPKDSDARYSVRTTQVSRRAATTRKKDALEIGAPAAGGAIVGGLLGGKKGALIGTTVGGGAGTAVVLTQRGKEIRLPRGTRLSVRLLDPVTVRVPVQE